MSDDLHRKLYNKLKHAQGDMPDFSPEEWLKLDSRLEVEEKRKKRRMLLLASLPFLLLLCINALLGWKLWTHTHQVVVASSTTKNTVVFDTIYQHVTVHQYDTIYHTIYKNSFPKSLYPGATPYQQRTPLEGMAGATGSPSSSIANNNGSGATSATEMKTEVPGTHNQTLQSLPYLSMALLPVPEKHWYDWYREISSRPHTPRRIPLIRNGHFSLESGPVVSWKGALSGNGGLSIAIGNEIEIGTERLSWWQELNWSKLQIKSEGFIPGFPTPPSPDPNAKLEKNIFTRRDLGIHMGFGYALPVKNIFEAQFRLGLGSNYRLGGQHLVDYEDHDIDKHYNLTENVTAGWDGWNGTAGLGVNWQATRAWQVQLRANYYRYLGGGLDDWRIPSWAAFRLGVNYRWR